MNYLRLLAELEMTPSEQEKETVETEMCSFLLHLAPSAELNIESGEGSWWVLVQGVAVAVGGWLSLQFAGWAVDKGLDYLADKAADRLDPPTANGPKLLALTERSGNEQTSKIPVFNLLAILGSEMSDLAERIGASQIVLGEWSEATGLGRVISLRRDANEITLSMYQTDSRDDLDSRTTYESPR